jgi:hypothetical protein
MRWLTNSGCLLSLTKPSSSLVGQHGRKPVGNNRHRRWQQIPVFPWIVHVQITDYRDKDPRVTFYPRCERTADPQPASYCHRPVPIYATVLKLFVEFACLYGHRHIEPGHYNRNPSLLNHRKRTAHRSVVERQE